MSLKHRVSHVLCLSLVSAGTFALVGCQSSGSSSSWSSKSQSTQSAQATQASLGDVGHLTLDSAGVTNRTVAMMRSNALDLLEQAVRSRNPVLRANAIEGLQFSHDGVSEAIRRGLVDENRGVRFVATMLVGKTRSHDLLPLVEPLQHDASDSVKAAAFYAMRRCNKKVDISPLARMVLSNDPEIRSNAVLVLGEMGDRSAIGLLRQSAGTGLELVDPLRRRVIDLQVAEAMVKLGAEREIEVIRAALFSPAEMGELTALAAMMCGEVRDGKAMGNLLDLATREGRRQEPAEVRMAATLGVARIDASRAPVHVPLSYVNAENFAHRAQAASTLGWIQRDESLSALSVLMGDSNPQVQVAAASAILRLSR